MRSAPLWLIALLSLVACSSDLPTADDGRLDLLFSFEEDAQSWSADFADYGVNQDKELLGFVFEHRPLPADVNRDSKALLLEGRNISDDLFMYLKRHVIGLQPNTTYRVTFELDLASNAPSNCVGIGGAPGESVFLKVGVSRTEPEPVIVDIEYRLSVDKGNQSQGGANALVIGTIANGEPCSADAPFRLIQRDNLATPYLFPTGPDGSLWLFVGTDSGFEGTTTLYYDTIRVVLEPVENR